MKALDSPNQGLEQGQGRVDEITQLPLNILKRSNGGSAGPSPRHVISSSPSRRDSRSRYNNKNDTEINNHIRDDNNFHSLFKKERTSVIGEDDATTGVTRRRPSIVTKKEVPVTFTFTNSGSDSDSDSSSDSGSDSEFEEKPFMLSDIPLSRGRGASGRNSARSQKSSRLRSSTSSDSNSFTYVETDLEEGVEDEDDEDDALFHEIEDFGSQRKYSREWEWEADIRNSAIAKIGPTSSGLGEIEVFGSNNDLALGEQGPSSSISIKPSVYVDSLKLGIVGKGRSSGESDSPYVPQEVITPSQSSPSPLSTLSASIPRRPANLPPPLQGRSAVLAPLVEDYDWKKSTTTTNTTKTTTTQAADEDSLDSFSL